MEKSEVFNASKVVEDYSSSVEELKEITTEITKTASDGRPISEELRSKLNKELDGLKTHYTNLCEKAHKISKDIPENPSIYDLQKIIEEYDKISSELSEIKEILTKFIRVTSKEPKYADAIRPYQDKARDIVEQIDNKAVGKEIVSSDTCKGAKCFTNALDNAMDNKNYADLDEETRDSLENIFKPKVISGLAANKYFLPPDKNHAESDDSAENKVVESEPEPVPVVETKKENTTVEERNADSNKSENQQNQNTISSENKTKEINSNGRPFIPEPHFFELITPSVENFLLLLRHIQIITPRQALGFCKNSRRFTSEKLNLRDMKKWFGEWVEKGFLSAITLPTEKEKVFCLPTNPLAGKNITPEIEKNIIFQLKKIDSHFHLFEKPKPISEPETTSPEAATEEPIKQIVQEEPAKQEELIEEIHAEQIPETEPEQKQEQEPEKSEETVKPEEPEEPEKAEKIAETKEPSNQTEEIDEDKNQEKDHLTTICELINSDKIYCATAYAKATNSPFYKALAYAVDDPDDPKAERDYLSDNIQKLIPITEEEKDFTEPLIVSAAMRTFFSARKEYDNLQQLHEIIRKFESNPKLKDAIYKLYKFKEKHNEGLDSCVSQNNISFDNQLDKLKEEAKDTIEKAAKKSSETTKHERFLKTKGLIFAQNSELIKFLDSIKSGTKDKDFYEKIRNFVSQNFIKEGFSVSTDTLDDDKIWQY
ncbi:hypothetical protein IKO70_10015, partial [bacterium]|nr:hypothetical protein [bacterium]